LRARKALALDAGGDARLMEMHGILKAATNGGPRRAHDFYPTPPEPTLALLPKLKGFPKKVWEPACGDGGIAKVLEQNGYDVVGTDLVDRGYGRGGIDYLTTTEKLANAVITNPPFGDLAHPFVEHTLDLGVEFIAMLFNINFWSAAVRTPLWNRRLPERVCALNWKPDFTGSGRPYFNCVWVVWRGKPTHTLYERLVKPSRPAVLESVEELLG
jgi:hypothetical protein